MASAIGAEAKDGLGPGKLPPEGSDLLVSAYGAALPGARLLAPRITTAESARSILQLCKEHLGETWSRVMAFELRASFVEDVFMEQDAGQLMHAMRLRVEDLELKFPEDRTDPPSAEEALKVALVMVQCAQLGPKLDRLYDLHTTDESFSEALKKRLAESFPALSKDVLPVVPSRKSWSGWKLGIPVVAAVVAIILWKRSAMKE